MDRYVTYTFTLYDTVSPQRYMYIGIVHTPKTEAPCHFRQASPPVICTGGLRYNGNLAKEDANSASPPHSPRNCAVGPVTPRYVPGRTHVQAMAAERPSYDCIVQHG
jgi:hypothetical protein